MLLYHGGVSWLPGGFLGVDVFFVISGYLITMLLLEEYGHSGRIGVRGFYRRRARRLLPALFVLLVTVCTVAAFFYREEASRLRGQVLSALTYCTNWYLIASDGSYFNDLGRPLVLRHLWSLAVEEQFYLLWPIVLLVLLRRFELRLGRLALVIGAIAAASVVWMAAVYQPGADPSRVYYGTDTRLHTLLIGALLALFWRPSALTHGRVRGHGRLFDVVGLAAIAGMIVFFLEASETGAAMYHGGFAVVAGLSALAVAAATHPATGFGRALGCGALIWIGVRSYALYLWHWPIYVITRPEQDVPLEGFPLLAVRLGLTVLLADLSFRLVERPIRRRGVRRWVRSAVRIGPAGRRRPAGVLVLASVFAAIAGVTAVLASSGGRVSDIELSLRAGQEAIATADPADQSGSASTADDPELAGPTAAATTVAPTRTAPTSAVTSRASTIRSEPTTPVTTRRRSTDPDATSTIPRVATTATTVPPTTLPPTTAPPATAPPATAPLPIGPIVALGDSVMLGAAPQLLEVFGPGTVVDAVVGRTLWPVVGIVATMQAEGRLGERVVIHLGDNGGVDPDLIARTMASLADVDRVLWLTVKVPRSWEGPVNATLAAEIPKYPNARLLDWKALATDPSMFYDDSIHLRPAGAAFYAELVRSAFAQP